MKTELFDMSEQPPPRINLNHNLGRTTTEAAVLALGSLLCIATIPFVPVGVPVLIASLAILVAVPPPVGEVDHMDLPA